MKRILRRHVSYPYYEVTKEDRIPRDRLLSAYAVARRRINGLLADYTQANRPLIDLLANAYLIGVEDGAFLVYDKIEKEPK